MTTRVIFFSGGIGSFATARRVIEQHGRDGVVLLFTDTKVEHPDLYRFLDDAVDHLQVPLEYLADGRDIWQVFKDKRLLGNTRVAPCSHELKQKPAKDWVWNNCDPADTVLYVGIDWSELHRMPAVEKGWLPYRVEAPLAAPPYIDKAQMLADAEALGVTPPVMYRDGFAHANCGGGCVRAGQGQFLHLHDTYPQTYAEWERKEQEMREFLGRDDIAILRDRRGGTTKPLTLTDLRLRKRSEIDADDIGGCGCFLDEPS